MSVHSIDLFSILVFITHSPFSRLFSVVGNAWITARLRYSGRDNSRPWDELGTNTPSWFIPQEAHTICLVVLGSNVSSKRSINLPNVILVSFASKEVISAILYDSEFAWTTA